VSKYTWIRSKSPIFNGITHFTDSVKEAQKRESCSNEFEENQGVDIRFWGSIHSNLDQLSVPHKRVSVESVESDMSEFMEIT